MKKLYENIEDIKIKGDIGQLTEAVTAMDRALQNIADRTERLTVSLTKYSASNKGAQYEKVVTTSADLRDILFEASQELNEMQNEVVAYQNKVYRYEDMPESASIPSNSYLVSKKQINVDTSMVQFTKSEMLDLVGELKNYSEGVFQLTRGLRDKKESMRNIWMDSQYDIFSMFIDKVTKYIVDALKVFDEYIKYLGEKIKELG